MKCLRRQHLKKKEKDPFLNCQPLPMFSIHPIVFVPWFFFLCCSLLIHALAICIATDLFVFYPFFFKYNLSTFFSFFPSLPPTPFLTPLRPFSFFLPPFRSPLFVPPFPLQMPFPKRHSFTPFHRPHPWAKRWTLGPVLGAKTSLAKSVP